MFGVANFTLFGRSENRSICAEEGIWSLHAARLLSARAYILLKAMGRCEKLRIPLQLGCYINVTIA